MPPLAVKWLDSWMSVPAFESSPWAGARQKAVAQRHGFTLPHHTSVLAPLMDYECQFPGWSIGPEPNRFVPDQLFDAVASLPDPPTWDAVLTNQNGSTDFVSYGSEDDRTGAVTIARERGLEVVAEVRYPPATTDWARIATQVRDAAPDLVVNNGLGVDPVNLLAAMARAVSRARDSTSRS